MDPAKEQLSWIQSPSNVGTSESLCPNSNHFQSQMESLGFVINKGVASFKLDSSSMENPSDGNMDFAMVNEDDTLSFVVLGKNSLELIQESSMASYVDIQQKSTSIDYGSMISSMNSDDIQKKLTELLQENSKLKETLKQNNTAMKQQISTLAIWQEDIMKVHHNHKKRFAETAELIKYLKEENNDLKMKLSMEQSRNPEAGYNNSDTGEWTLPKVSLFNESNSATKSEDLSCNMEDRASTSYDKRHKQSEEDPTKESVIDVQHSIAVHECEHCCKKNEEIGFLKQRVNSLEDKLKHATTPVQFCVRSPSNITEYHRQRTENMREYVERLQQVTDFFDMHIYRANNTATYMKNVLETVELILSKLSTDCSKCDYCSILDTTVLKACRDKLAVCYKKILQEEEELIKDQQNATKSQNQFRKILSDYECTWHELEAMMGGNARTDTSKSSDEGVRKTRENLIRTPADPKQLLEPERQRLAREKQNIEREKQLLSKQKADLDLQSKTLNQARELLQQEKISLTEEKMSLDQQSQLYENFERALQLEKKALEVKCRRLTDETETLRAELREANAQSTELLSQKKQQEETLYLLQTQLKVYEEDFRQEAKVKYKLLEDRNKVVSDLQKQMEFNKSLLEELSRLEQKNIGETSKNKINPPTLQSAACPKCGNCYSSSETLIEHIGSCLDLQ